MPRPGACLAPVALCMPGAIAAAAPAPLWSPGRLSLKSLAGADTGVPLAVHVATALAGTTVALVAARACRDRTVLQQRRLELLGLQAGRPLSDGTVAIEDEVEELKRRLAPGPLKPETTAGHALRRILRVAPEHFRVFQDYEVLRAKLGGEEVSQAEEAEALVLYAYWQLLEHGGCPARPAANSMADYQAHAQTFNGASLDALEHCTSPDFQLLAQAHVKVLVQNVPLPWLRADKARSLYESAMSFGHGLRQAETRFQIDGAAGTFVPLPVEAQMARNELEEAWTRTMLDDESLVEAVPTVAPGASVPQRDQHQNDAEGAQRSLEQVLARLHRMGETRPGLATYLNWLGNFDPEAWSMLMQPSPLLALAMRKQVDAVWGEESEVQREVAMTPSDLVEAVLFGAWLHDAEFAAEDLLSKHRQLGCNDHEPNF